MKKLLFVCVALTASLLFSKTTGAQTTKIGYFDEESVLGSFPDIGKIDTLMAVYTNDSIGVEYNYRLSEYQKADSTFKKDSASLPPKARELALRDLYQKRGTLVNWQQIAEQMRSQKLDQLLLPYRQRIIDALKAIVAEGKYTMVLNANALSPYVQRPLADDLSIRVALRLKLPVSKEVEDAFRAATSGGGAPANRPK
jgi:Skp family chaperone for outer membrane proteins